jgi:ankyrin repeat protein
MTDDVKFYLQLINVPLWETANWCATTFQFHKICIAFLTVMLIGCQPSDRKYQAKDYFADSKVADLAEAARDGAIERIDNLVSQVIDVNAKGKKGITPLIYAMTGKTTKGFECLLEHGADPNLKIETGSSAVSFAAEHQDSEFLKLVLAHGGNPNINSNTPRYNVNYTPTPIFKAIWARNPENARILIKAGADLNVRNSDRSTPLISSAIIRSYDVMYVLLEAGADFRAKGSYGYPFSSYILDVPNLDDESRVAKVRQKCMEFMEKKGVDFEKEKLEKAEIARQREEELDKEEADKEGEEKEEAKVMVSP